MVWSVRFHAEDGEVGISSVIRRAGRSFKVGVSAVDRKGSGLKRAWMNERFTVTVPSASFQISSFLRQSRQGRVAQGRRPRQSWWSFHLVSSVYTL